jgi:hypothetical protein
VWYFALLIAIGGCSARATRPLAQCNVPERAGCGHAPLTEVPFELHHNVISLEATFAGETHRAFLASGDRCMFDKDAVAPRAPIGLPSPGTDEKMGEFSVTIGGVKFVARDAFVSNLSAVRDCAGCKAIVGDDVFAMYDVEIDYATRWVRLWDRYDGPGESIPLDVSSDGKLFVHAMLVGSDGVRHAAKLELDTADAHGLDLDDAYVDTEHLFSPASTRIETLWPSGAKTTFASRLGALELGTQHIPGPIVTYPSELPRHGDAGMLGGEILRQFRVVFEQRRGRLVLAHREPLAPVIFDLVGVDAVPQPPINPHVIAALHISPPSNPFDVVLGVLTVNVPSPAHDAGIVPNDEILAIDGARPSADTLFAHSHQSTTFTMRVRHADAQGVLQARDVTIRPRKTL